MAKKRKEDPPKGSAAWMNTFADLMNLLLCFFVLLFSMSSVNEQKFQQVAASFSQKMSFFQAGSTAIGDGVMISNGISQLTALDEYMNSNGKSAEGNKEIKDAVDKVETQKLQKSEQLAEKIEETLKEESLDKAIDINFTSQYVQLTLNGALLFDSGSAQLKEESIPIMDKVGQILMRYAESLIEVEGHTDNVPIHNARFNSNNELSSARALSVFDFLVANTNLQPSGIKHSGRGEFIPVADNATPEGRAKNRRVEIKIYHTLSSY